ncbi:hypothetical protein F5Y11DRAFT_141510 [Daldinia sp. FL1419]|nr:hypothetical protein F5Y11DRAFT_141510 [Daldinia sp. FL1419]
MSSAVATKRKAFFIVCLLPCAAVYYCLKYTLHAVEETVDFVSRAQAKHRVKTRKRPKSEPLAVVPAAPSNGNEKEERAKTSFLNLPPEIRLMIYRLVMAGPAIIQVRPTYSVRGPRPETWAPMQGIRDEVDEPSQTLRLTIGLGGSPMRQVVAPPRAGCVVYGCISQLICGDTYYFTLTRYRAEGCVHFTDLMRAGRVVYGEALDLLYAEHTVSLFGVEMARYFCRNASPEGMSRVRFLHVALIISASSWTSSLQRKSIKDTIRLLRESMPNVEQLDVEIAVTWGQPKQSGKFWKWLTGDDLLGQFQGLDRFVLKASAYVPFARRPYGNWAAWTPQYEKLGSWDEEEYKALKGRVTNEPR